MQTALAQLGSLVPLPPAVPSPRNLRSAKAVARLDEIVYRMISDRRAQGGDRGDVLGMLLARRTRTAAP